VPADASGAAREVSTRAPLLPLALDGRRLPLRRGPPGLGAHTRDLLSELGYADGDIQRLHDDGVIGP
jgi:crotonobetainyl-CoA:carnitine CoA-transferase CaiB-like acyl-CoA transferase